MDKESLNQYYANLLIKQYTGDTKASQTIRSLVNINSEIIFNICGEFNEKFGLETATGKQLDIIGEIVGINRNLSQNLNLDDENYRNFIKFKIIHNISTTGTNKIENNVFNAFDENVILVNNYDMSIDYIFNNQLDETTKQILKDNIDLLPSPTGVKIRIIFNIQTEKIFGFANNDGTIPKYIVGFSGNTMEDLQPATVLDNDNILNP